MYKITWSHKFCVQIIALLYSVFSWVSQLTAVHVKLLTYNREMKILTSESSYED